MKKQFMAHYTSQSHSRAIEMLSLLYKRDSYDMLDLLNHVTTQ